jgi:hypothetical protein
MIAVWLRYSFSVYSRKAASTYRNQRTRAASKQASFEPGKPSDSGNTRGAVSGCNGAMGEP